MLEQLHNKEKKDSSFAQKLIQRWKILDHVKTWIIIGKNPCICFSVTIARYFFLFGKFLEYTRLTLKFTENYFFILVPCDRLFQLFGSVAFVSFASASRRRKSLKKKEPEEEGD